MPSSLIGTSYITDLAWIQIRESLCLLTSIPLSSGSDPCRIFWCKYTLFSLKIKIRIWKVLIINMLAILAYLYVKI